MAGLRISDFLAQREARKSGSDERDRDIVRTVTQPVTRTPSYEISPNTGLPIYSTGGSTASSAPRVSTGIPLTNRAVTYGDDADIYKYGAYDAYAPLDQYDRSGSYESPMSSLQSELEAARIAQEEAAAQRKAAYETALRSQYGTSLGSLGQGAAGANTSEYVRYMQNQAKLPQQAALMGTGGLSESSLMGLQAAYGGNLNAIELERARGQAELENQLAQGIATGEGQYAETLAGIGSDYANKLLTLSMQEQANQLAREQALQQQASAARQYEQQQAYKTAQDLQAQANWEKQFGFTAEQAAIENALNAQKFAASQSKSTVGVKAYKPTLTLAQTESAIKAGNTSKNVTDAYEYYYGEPYKAKVSALDTLTVNFLRSQGYTDQQIANALSK